MRRASLNDAEYGVSCPTCSGPKTLQALRCAPCYAESLRNPDFWDVRTCACGGPKCKESAKCLRCEHDRLRGVDTLGAARVVATEGHPWRGHNALVFRTVAA